MEPIPASHSFSPPKKGGPEQGRVGETKASRERIGLDYGVELGALLRHPDSLQAGGR